MKNNLEYKNFDTKKQKLEKVLEQLKVVTDGLGHKIESGVIEECAYLNTLGLLTTQSCEGHAGPHGLPYPWIEIGAENHPELKKIHEQWNNHLQEYNHLALAQSLNDLGLAESDHLTSVEITEIIQKNSTNTDLLNKIYELELEKWQNLREEASRERYFATFKNFNKEFNPDWSSEECYNFLQKLPSQEEINEISSHFYKVKFPEDKGINIYNLDYYERIFNEIKRPYEAEILHKATILLEKYQNESNHESDFSYILWKNRIVPKVVAEQGDVATEGLGREERLGFLQKAREGFSDFSLFLKKSYHETV